MQETSILNYLVITAIEASEIIMKYYKSDYNIETKNDASPVTLADREADNFICKKISKISDDLIISEEGNKIYSGENKFWLIDPLDGTKSFIKADGNFTINIAFIESGYPSLGIILVPAKNDLYFTKNGQSYYAKLDSYQNLSVEEYSKHIIDKAKPIKTNKNKENESLVVVASKSHLDDDTKNYIDKLNVKEFVSAGSSIKFCLVAKGEADIYPRFAPTMLWDTAAGQAILEQAGGKVLTPEGERFAYKPIPNDPESQRNGFFIAKA